jgi:hypothetical protein
LIHFELILVHGERQGSSFSRDTFWLHPNTEVLADTGPLSSHRHSPSSSHNEENDISVTIKKIHFTETASTCENTSNTNVSSSETQKLWQVRSWQPGPGWLNILKLALFFFFFFFAQDKKIPFTFHDYDHKLLK